MFMNSRIIYLLFTNHERYLSRTIFFIFTNSRTTKKWRVSRYHEHDFVNSRITNHKCFGVHEFTNRCFNFHEFTNHISCFHESRTKSFSRIHERLFSFSRIHERKKANSRLHERRWGGLLYARSTVSFSVLLDFD